MSISYGALSALFTLTPSAYCQLINLPGLICRSLHVFTELSDAVAFVLAAYEEAEAIIFMFYKKGLITGNMHGESPFKVWNTFRSSKL
jgi:hypothetical protein